MGVQNYRTKFMFIEWCGLEVEPGLNFLVAAAQITLQLCIMRFGDLTNYTTRPTAVKFGVNAAVGSDKKEMVSWYFKCLFTGTSMLSFTHILLQGTFLNLAGTFVRNHCNALARLVLSQELIRYSRLN